MSTALVPKRRWKISPEGLARIRENSKKSTGPKDCSLVRFNSMTHGLRAQLVIIPGEDPFELEQLKDEAYERFDPKNDTETELVEQIVFAMWRLRRARNAEKVIVEKYSGLNRTRWEEVLDMDYLDKITKYETHANNQISRAIETLMCLRGVRKLRTENKENKDKQRCL